jgi:hypothetical protein
LVELFDLIMDHLQEAHAFLGHWEAARLKRIIPIPAADFDRTANIWLVEQIPHKDARFTSEMAHHRPDMQRDGPFIILRPECLLGILGHQNGNNIHSPPIGCRNEAFEMR